MRCSSEMALYRNDPLSHGILLCQRPKGGAKEALPRYIPNFSDISKSLWPLSFGGRRPFAYSDASPPVSGAEVGASVDGAVGASVGGVVTSELGGVVTSEDGGVVSSETTLAMISFLL